MDNKHKAQSSSPSNASFTERIEIRVSPEMKVALEDIAQTDPNLSISQIIRDSIDDYLEINDVEIDLIHDDLKSISTGLAQSLNEVKQEIRQLSATSSIHNTTNLILNAESIAKLEKMADPSKARTPKDILQDAIDRSRKVSHLIYDKMANQAHQLWSNATGKDAWKEPLLKLGIPEEDNNPQPDDPFDIKGD